jgi:hypothetical protein
LAHGWSKSTTERLNLTCYHALTQRQI